MAGLFDMSGASMNGASMNGANMSGGTQQGGGGFQNAYGTTVQVDPIAAYAKAMQAKMLGYQVNQAQQGDALRTTMFDRMQNAIKAHMENGGQGGTAQDLYWDVPEFRNYIDQYAPDTAKFINEQTNNRIEQLRKSDPKAAANYIARTQGRAAGVGIDRANDPANWETKTLDDGTVARLPKIDDIGGAQQMTMQNGKPVFAPIDMDKVMATAQAQVAKGEKMTPAMLGTVHQYAGKLSMDGDRTQGDPNTGNVSKYNTARPPLAMVHDLIAKNDALLDADPGGAAPTPGVNGSGQRPGVTPGKIGTGVAPGKQTATSPAGVQAQPNGTKTLTSGGVTFIQAPMGAAVAKEADEALGTARRVHDSGDLIAANWDPSLFTSTGEGKAFALQAQAKSGIGGPLSQEQQNWLGMYTKLHGAFGTEYVQNMHSLFGSRITQAMQNVTKPVMPTEEGAVKSFFSVDNNAYSSAQKFKNTQIYAAISGAQALASKYDMSAAEKIPAFAVKLSNTIDQEVAQYRQTHPGVDPTKATALITMQNIREFNDWARTRYTKPSPKR